MTVSYKKSGPGSGDYYINCMTTKDGTVTVDDYYTGGSKEPPGIWYVGPDASGARNTRMGITHGASFSAAEGINDVERFSILIQGFNPETGEKMVQNAGELNRIALHDFTFSVPKSVSVVWSQADAQTKEKIEGAVLGSARVMMDFLSTKAYTRTGKEGINKIQAPMRGAMFPHASSRENDPQLHTHCTTFNICERPDGKSSALETASLLRWQGAAASLAHVNLAHQMTEIGFGVKPDKVFEIEGVPPEILTAFSKRSAQLRAAAVANLKKLTNSLEKSGVDESTIRLSRGLLQVATIESRDVKNELTRAELDERWIHEGRRLGFSTAQVQALLRKGPSVGLKELDELTEEDLLEGAIEAIDQITETDAVFSEPAIITSVSKQLMGRASVEQVQKAVQLVMTRHLMVVRAAHTTAGDFRIAEEEDRFTTRDMLICEMHMVKLANRKDSSHVLPSVEEALTQHGAGMDSEQRAAALAACTDENSVTIIEGTAGAGKTFSMGAVARTYEQNGYTVRGLSSGWVQAKTLEQDAKLAMGRAIAGWVNDVRSGKLELNSKTALILDEAGMISARDMRNVLDLAEQAGAKVILLGDTKQQKSVGAGDALRVLKERFGSHRIDEIRRQRDPQRSTLDFNGWQTADGAQVDREQEAELADLHLAAAEAREAIERAASTSWDERLLTEAPAENNLTPFQKSDRFILDDLPADQAASITLFYRLIDEEGIDPLVLAQAHKDGFFIADGSTPQGEAVFVGRRLGLDSAPVHYARDSACGNSTDDQMLNRDRFPPVWHAPGEKVDVVSTGIDALRLRSAQSREGMKPSTIIVSNNRTEALSMPLIRRAMDLSEKAGSLYRYDVDQARSKRSLTSKIGLQKAVEPRFGSKPVGTRADQPKKAARTVPAQGTSSLKPPPQQANVAAIQNVEMDQQKAASNEAARKQTLNR